MACCIARARWAGVAVGTSSLQSYLFVPAATLAHQTALRAVAPGLNEKVDNPTEGDAPPARLRILQPPPAMLALSRLQ